MLPLNGRSDQCTGTDITNLGWLLEHLHTIVIIIDHIYIVLGIHGQIRRSVELAVAIACFAPNTQKRPTRIELADAILCPIRYIYIAPRISRDAARINKE